MPNCCIVPKGLTSDKTEFGKVEQQIENHRKKLQQLTETEVGNNHENEIRMVRHELNEWMDKKEVMWRQTSQVQWLQEGDRNTRYFHTKANLCRKQDEMRAIEDELGRRVEGNQDMGRVAVNYFEKIYTSSHPSRVSDVTQGIQQKVTNAMNVDLCREFTSKEVGIAVKDIYPTKASGPDGMSVLFYQKILAQHWR